MAWAWVKSDSVIPAAGAGTTSVKAFTGGNTAGNFLFAMAVWGGATGGATFADTANLAWTATVKTTNDGGNTQSMSSCFFPNCAGGANTVTATAALADFRGMVIREASGIVTTSPEDGTAAGNVNGASTTQTSPSVTVSQANDMVVGCVCEDTAGTAAITSSDVTIHANDRPAISNNVNIACGDKNGPASGAVTATFAFGSSQGALIQCRCFKQAAGGGATFFSRDYYDMIGVR